MPDVFVPISRRTSPQTYPRFITAVMDGYKILTTYDVAGAPDGGTTIAPIEDGDELYIIMSIDAGLNLIPIEKQDFYFWPHGVPFLTDTNYQYVLVRLPEELNLSDWYVDGSGNWNAASCLGRVNSSMIDEIYDDTFAWDNLPALSLGGRLMDIGFSGTPAATKAFTYHAEQSYVSTTDYRRVASGADFYGMSFVCDEVNSNGIKSGQIKYVFGTYSRSDEVERGSIDYPDSAFLHFWDKRFNW